MKRVSLLAALLIVSCSRMPQEGWTEEELNIIRLEAPVLRVLQVTEREDETVLRHLSSDIPVSLIGGEDWGRLSAHLLATVQDDANPGVGIAGPQVGVSRRVVAVQRFDKDGEPFEVYPNIRIITARGEREYGPEGCLSVPDRSGEVLRWRDIDIAYTSSKTLNDTVETVRGFTAVIFQHEYDHLDGLLYTDRLDAQNEPECITDDIRFCLNHPDGQYAVGEEVVVTAGLLGIYDKPVEVTVSEFGRRSRTIQLGKIGIRDTVFTFTPQRPTAQTLEFREEGRTPDELPFDVNLGEDMFRIGFVAGAGEFEPGNPDPGDVKEFWADQVARMRETPLESTLIPVRVDSTLECYDVTVSGPDGVPVRGYYAKPVDAAPGSLPIFFRLHSAGVSGQWCRAKTSIAARFARRGAICFNFNAHGMANDREQAYYDSLDAGPLWDYSARPLEDRRTYYFKNMILRAVRALDFATQDPAWDGRTVIVYGDSQGGYQSVMLAGIDPRVTDVLVGVPAGVGTGGSLVARCDSWPYVLDHSGRSQYALDNAPYFDGAILLKGCKADFVVEVGLIDTTCPPSEIFSGFNQVSGNVRYLTCPYRTHHQAKIARQYLPWWEENVGDVREAAIDEIAGRR